MTRRDARRGETEITVFGQHPIREAIRSQGARVCEVKLVKGRSTPDHRALRFEVVSAGIAIEEISRSELSRYSGAPRHDQGVAARVRLMRVIEVEAFVEASKGRAARRPVRVIALDGVTNSQNVGMVVRSVVGAGIDGILWPMRGQPWINGLVVRAAAGSIFDCPIIRCELLTTGLAALQAAGYSCVGLEADADRSLFAPPVSSKRLCPGWRSDRAFRGRARPTRRSRLDSHGGPARVAQRRGRGWARVFPCGWADRKGALVELHLL